MRPPEKSPSPHNRFRGATHLLLCSSFPCRDLSVNTSLPATLMPFAAHTDLFAFCYHPAHFFLVPGFVSLSSLPAHQPISPSPTSHPLSLPYRPVFPDVFPSSDPASHLTRPSKPCCYPAEWPQLSLAKWHSKGFFLKCPTCLFF